MNWTFWNRRKDAMPSPDQPDWERALINRMAADYLRDQRGRRRWGIFFKFLILLYLIGILVAAYSQDLIERMSSTENHTALVEVKGIIAPETDASADNVITALRAAFKSDQVKGIILRINSPGRQSGAGRLYQRRDQAAQGQV